MKTDINESLEIPEEVTAKKENWLVIVKGPKGELKREFFDPRIEIRLEEKMVELSSKKATKREKAKLYTFKAHLKNMLEGVKEPYVYKLKICSSHFPMGVSVSGDQFVVKNFLGEKTPRSFKINSGVEVKVSGDQITVISADKELAGQTASMIEILTTVKKRDLRVFQEGIYIVEKCGKKIK